MSACVQLELRPHWRRVSETRTPPVARTRDTSSYLYTGMNIHVPHVIMSRGEVHDVVVYVQ